MKAGIDPERRAETLDIKEFAALANAVSQGIEDEDKDNTRLANVFSKLLRFE